MWGVHRMEGRKQQLCTVGEGEEARRKAEKLARKLTQKATKMMMSEGMHIAMKTFVPMGILKGRCRSPSLTRRMQAEMKINA